MSSRFEKLPVEVREKIYFFYSEDIAFFTVNNYGKDDVGRRIGRTEIKPADVSEGHKKAVPLMSVSKTIHRELLPSLIKFCPYQIRRLHMLLLGLPMPKFLPHALVAKLRVLHLTTDIKHFDPRHAMHLAFPRLAEITIKQDPSERITMPVPDPRSPYYDSNAWKAAHYVHETGKDRTIAAIDRVVKARCKTINHAFFDNLLSRKVSIRVIMPFGGFIATNMETRGQIRGDTIVATTENTLAAPADEDEDEDDKKKPGWRWTATETDFTEDLKLFEEFTTEGGDDVRLNLSISWIGE